MTPGRHPRHRVYAVLFSLIGLTLGYFATDGGVSSPLFAWLGLCFVLMGWAYAVGEPRIFGKHADGSLAFFRVFLLLPYVAVVGLVWHAQRAFSREPPYHLVDRGLYLGCWPRRDDCPKDVDLVVDLTAELPRDARGSFEYLLVPTLDGCSPTIEKLGELAERLAKHEGAAYLHCAAGHGRSATVAAAVLVLRGSKPTVEEAIAHLRATRPGVRVNPVQRSVLDAWSRR